MSHEITCANGRHECFVTGEKPWHNLGVVVENAPNSEEAIKLAGLDWSVEKSSLFIERDPENVQYGIVDGYNAMTRADTGDVLGIVTDRYQPIQNIEAFNFLDSLMQDGIIKYESAGSLKGGRVVWMLARIPTEYQVIDGDNVEPYVLFTTSHDGTGAAQMLPTAVRVVCNNTLRLALTDTSKSIRIVHSGNVWQKLSIAQDFLKLANQRFGVHIEDARRMAQKTIDRATFNEYLIEVFPEVETGKAKTIRENVREDITINYHGGKEQEHCRNTVWAAYNAVSHYVDHQSRTRQSDRMSENESRFNKVLLGSGHQVKQKAWDTALALV